MKIGNYDFKEVEQNSQDFWKSQSIYAKVKAQNKDGKVFYFLDGPPYTSGRVHLGTALNKSLKDTFLRYKRMQGFNVWDRAGYDMHGLPTEHAVEKKFGMHGKEDILKMGMESFVRECEKLSVGNMLLMNEDFGKLGVWMDFENAYQSIKPSFIEGVWWVVKKAHEQKRLYEGLRTMHWCASCATAVAKHELEYKEVTDNSIFVKLQLKGKPDSFLIIWTTTPWTIPFNLAVMVNPELEYVKCKVDNEHWYVSKALAGAFVQGVVGKKLVVEEEFLGEKMEGMEYIHPFEKEISEYSRIKLQSPKAHTVLLSTEYVDTSAGTGLVHCAPGCGPEDYEVGVRNKIPPYNNIDEKGAFPPNMGEFAGLVARKDDKKFIEALKKRGAIIDVVPVEHEYAHCWRCHNPVVFRTTTQWFFRIEDLKDKLIEANKKINWVNGAGASAMDGWLRNLRDNSITKQRFWGTPLPVWKCQHCHDYVVIGSQKELETMSKMKLDNLHKPWIDEVTIPCKCGASKTRIPDVMDVWLDAGTNAWTCLDFPQREDLVKSMYPAEFILEGKEQIRGWFYLLLLEGQIGFDAAPMKNVYMHGWINDSFGRKMSKSLGNYILPEEVTAQYGADAFRFYMIGSAMPGVDGCYNQEEIKAKFRNLGVLWNLHKYLIELAVTHGYSASDLESVKLDPKTMPAEERYILSKMHTTIMKMTQLYDQYRLNETPALAEELFLEFSRTYIQLVRDKLATGDDSEKMLSASVIYQVLRNVILLFAPTAPFVTEQMWQNLREAFGWEVPSVHMGKWPSSDKKYLNPDLEDNMHKAQTIMQAILAAREKAQLSVRWPIARVTVVTAKEELNTAVEMLGDLIKSQTNVKELKLAASMKGVTMSARLDSGKLGGDFGALTPRVMIAYGKEKSAIVLANILKENKHTFMVETKEVILTSKHVAIDRSVPGHLVEIETKGGFVYLDKTRTPELDAEGYVRELMRKIQQMRKDKGLEKRDRVALHIKTTPDMLKHIAKYEDVIGEKVGAKDITLNANNATGTFEWTSSEKIKDIIFDVWMRKV